MTSRAMGAATRPPLASLPASPPSSTITATATFGSSAGAKEVNHACGAGALAVLGRAGLAGDARPRDLRAACRCRR